MSGALRVGQYVEWPWGRGTAEGQIVERFEHSVERTLGGSRVKRNGSADDPAFLIEQEDGTEVLKLSSELSASRHQGSD